VTLRVGDTLVERTLKERDARSEGKLRAARRQRRTFWRER
jgi:hypothetical protein